MPSDIVTNNCPPLQEFALTCAWKVGKPDIWISDSRGSLDKTIEEDNETDAVLMIGEIGGPQEVAAGKFAKENMKKPVIAYIAGLTAPKGRVLVQLLN